MCNDCATDGLNRRNMIKLASLGLAASALAGASTQAAVAAQPKSTGPFTPAEALAKLKEGNKRFVADADACASQLATVRHELAGGQHPWATVLTCSDSRVAPELVFGGATLGELFVVRNAGNVLDTGALGTIEYGAEHLKAPLVIVMGHKKCGAVTAAVEEIDKGTPLGGSIGKMVQPILPVALAAGKGGGDVVGRTVRDNAISGARRITDESAIMAELVEAGKVKVIAGVYDIETGQVEFIEHLG